MLNLRDLKNIKVILIFLWLGFSLSLAIWWVIFGLRQLNQLAGLDHLLGEQIIRHQTMLMSEGAILVLSLLAGGVALLYFTYQETLKRREIETFFSAFTHDLKTSLTSLRLQADTLKEELVDILKPGSTQELLINRLLKDSVRLELQLENSLLVSSRRDHLLYNEEINLLEMMKSVHLSWPELSMKLDVPGHLTLKTDRRALQMVIKNVVHNAITHGKATEVSAQTKLKDHSFELLICDNGIGFKEDPKKLGWSFGRQQAGSGSGVGLVVVRELTRRLGGQVVFFSKQGFCVNFQFPIAMLKEKP